jgi:hypothetical protein
MLKYSTDELPPHERFAQWREVRAKNIYGVTIELEKALQPAFQGSFSAIKVGEATLIELHASPYQVSRSWADIEDAPSDSLCIYQQLDGENWFDTGRHGEFVIGAGAFGTSYSDLPYVTTPTKQSGYHLRLLKIPFARCEPMVERNRELPAQLLNGSRVGRIVFIILCGVCDPGASSQGRERGGGGTDVGPAYHRRAGPC